MGDLLTIYNKSEMWFLIVDWLKWQNVILIMGLEEYFILLFIKFHEIIQTP